MYNALTAALFFKDRVWVEYPPSSSATLKSDDLHSTSTVIKLVREERLISPITFQLCLKHFNLSQSVTWRHTFSLTQVHLADCSKFNREM